MCGSEEALNLLFKQRTLNDKSSSSETDLCKYELCGEVDVVQFLRLLHLSPLLLHQDLYGVLQLLAVKPQTK